MNLFFFFIFISLLFSFLNLRLIIFILFSLFLYIYFRCFILFLSFYVIVIFYNPFFDWYSTDQQMIFIIKVYQCHQSNSVLLSKGTLHLSKFFIFRYSALIVHLCQTIFLLEDDLWIYLWGSNSKCYFNQFDNLWF